MLCILLVQVEGPVLQIVTHYCINIIWRPLSQNSCILEGGREGGVENLPFRVPPI